MYEKRNIVEILTIYNINRRKTLKNCVSFSLRMFFHNDQSKKVFLNNQIAFKAYIFKKSYFVLKIFLEGRSREENS